VLLGDDTCSLRLTVAGYQYPHAADPVKRFSWHMVDGEARTPDGAWRFRYPALMCEETPMVAMWLTTVADWMEAAGEDLAPPVLTFSAPNLTLRVLDSPDPGHAVHLEVGLDDEFKPPWQRYEGSSGYLLDVEQDVRSLRLAAVAWIRETAPYPDGLEQLADGAEAD
jgi:hypothetical protein